MQSKATTVKEYLAELPEDRRAAIAAVRAAILANLDEDYEEGMSYGMIGYTVPHRVYPAGYHCNPAQAVPFACLASQKNYLSFYLMSLYEGPDEDDLATFTRWFREAWEATGRKLDMGKCCVRFKRIEDVPLDVIGEAIRRMPARQFIAIYERSLAAAAERKRSGTSARPKPAAKSTKASATKAKATAKSTKPSATKAKPAAKSTKAKTKAKPAAKSTKASATKAKPAAKSTKPSATKAKPAAKKAAKR